MTRTKALATAAQKFVAMNRELFATYALPRAEMDQKISEIEARYNYKHGWMQVGGFSLSSDEFAPGDRNQGGWAWA